MKVKVTKVMVKTLNNVMERFYPDPEKRPFHFIYSEMTTDQYRIYVNCYDCFLDDRDLNFDTGKMKVISVIYHPDYFAVNNYLSTRDLNNIYKKGDDVTSFSRRVIDAVMI